MWITWVKFSFFHSGKHLEICEVFQFSFKKTNLKNCWKEGPHQRIIIFAHLATVQSIQ